MTDTMTVVTISGFSSSFRCCFRLSFRFSISRPFADKVVSITISMSVSIGIAITMVGIGMVSISGLCGWLSGSFAKVVVSMMETMVKSVVSITEMNGIAITITISWLSSSHGGKSKKGKSL